MTLDDETGKRLQAFSDKHCGGKVARIDLLRDLCAVVGLRLRVEPK